MSDSEEEVKRANHFLKNEKVSNSLRVSKLISINNRR